MSHDDGIPPWGGTKESIEERYEEALKALESCPRGWEGPNEEYYTPGPIRHLLFDLMAERGKMKERMDRLEAECEQLSANINR